MQLQHSTIINEHVDYEHPLLCLKIWEIHHPRTERLQFGPWHYHKEIEFLAILEGSITVETRERHDMLRQGDVLLLGSNELHRTIKAADTAIAYIVFQVDPLPFFAPSMMMYRNLFADNLDSLAQLNYIFADHPPIREQVFAHIHAIYEEIRQTSKGYEMSVGIRTNQILYELLSHDTLQTLQWKKTAELLRLQPALTYIDGHLADKIQAAELSRLLSLNYYSFIKLFKKTMGVSLVDYIHYKRVQTAERYLLSEGVSIGEAGQLSGFEDRAQFNKIFKRYNRCTPKQFRERLRENGPTA